MADVFSDFYDALAARIAAVWPDCILGGIYEGGQIVYMPAKLPALPYASVVVEEWTPDDEGGGSNLTWSAPVEIWRVQVIDGKTATLRALRTSLKALVDDLWADNLTAGQLKGEEPRVGYEDTLPANMPLFEQRQDIRAGRVTAQIMVGETP